MATMGIMSLKSDILFELLKLVAATDPPHALPWVEPGPLKYHLGWVRLSHVCRLWRTLLLEMPSLWARAVCALPLAHDTMLARAQDQPLRLTLDISISRSVPLKLPSEHSLRARLAEFASKHVARAGSFGPGGDGRNWVPVFNGVHLPFLKDIDLRQEQRFGDQTPVACLMPLDAPILESVRLYHLAVTFTSQSIRQLILHGKAIFCHDGWKLLSVLRSLNLSLEYLELEMRPPSLVNWRAQSTTPIPLDALKHCHFYGTANSNLPELVDLLETPSPLEEHTYYVHIEPEGWERFVHALGPTLSQPSFNALFFTDDSNQIVASIFTAVDKPELYPSSASQEATLEVEYGRDSERAKAITSAMLGYLDRARIEQIVFGHDLPEEKVHDARATFRPFEAVTSYAALSHDSLKVLRANDDGPIFPKLTLLIATMEQKYGMAWDAESLLGWWSMVRGVLEDRISAGVPISRLRLASNATPVPATDALRDVEADGLAQVKQLVPELEDTRKVFESP